MEVHFENIKSELINLLTRAKHSIHIAVAWVTDRDLIDVLAGKAEAGIIVSLIVNDDDITAENSTVPLKRLEDSGAQVFRIGGEEEMMHHKFCIIDNTTVVTGSYNWSRKASSNYENIVVSNDKIVATAFIAEFYTLYKINHKSFRIGKELDNRLSEATRLPLPDDLLLTSMLFGEGKDNIPFPNNKGSKATMPKLVGRMQLSQELILPEGMIEEALLGVKAQDKS